MEGWTYQVQPPASVRELVRARTRYARGNRELARLRPDLAGRDIARYGGLGKVAASPRLWPAVAVLVSVHVASAAHRAAPALRPRALRPGAHDDDRAPRGAGTAARARSTTAPRVAVVIPARDEAEVLPRCLDSLLAQRGALLDVAVVANGCGDGTAATARRFVPRFVAAGHRLQVRERARPGKAGALDAGDGCVDGDVRVYLDADAVLSAGAAAALATALAGPRALLAAPRLVLEPAERVVVAAETFTVAYPASADIASVVGRWRLGNAELAARGLAPQRPGLARRRAAALLRSPDVWLALPAWAAVGVLGRVRERALRRAGADTWPRARRRP